MTIFHSTSDLRSDEIFLKCYKTTDADPKKFWAPAYYFKICLTQDGTEVGEINLRIGNTEKLFFGGNIGYNVDEDYRGNRYAAKACRLLYPLAVKHGMEYMYISCNPDNHASFRTLEIAGGKFVATVNLPEDNEMYIQRGVKQKCIFYFDLKEGERNELAQ